MDDSSQIQPEWFLNFKEVIKPKEIKSLVDLWEQNQFPKQFRKWTETRKTPNISYEDYETILGLKVTTQSSEEKLKELDIQLNKFTDLELYGIVRGIHMKVHLQELDEDTRETTKLSSQKMILQSFLDFFFQKNKELEGNYDLVVEQFEEFVNKAVLRLVSTVHPNETERSTNLLHYNHVFEKYVEWQKDAEAIKHVDNISPEYKIRRSILNGIRREIKSEIEGTWQSDQMRDEKIPVTSEGRRIMERYKIIFNSLPFLVKFVKQITKEAYLLYSACHHSQHNEEFNKVFWEYFRKTSQTREEKGICIKKTLIHLGIKYQIPKIKSPLITFGTWKGGDRDGNPYVIAAFSNQTFIEHKEFILEKYLEMVTPLIDNLTSSLDHVICTDELKKSVQKDRKTFPYIFNIKFKESYRAKLRYMMEKLKNTLDLTKQIAKKAGESTQPLLSLSFPGPAGYNYASELQDDINLLYNSLVAHSGKAQARSKLQDLKILVETFGFHMCSVDFRQTSTTNSATLAEYLNAVEMTQEAKFIKSNEQEKRKILLSLLFSETLEFNPYVLNSLNKTSKDTFQSLIIFADAHRTNEKSVGKFIISMTQDLSDILVLMILLKFVGLLNFTEGKLKGRIDITGLYETIGDLQNSSKIIKEYFSIPQLKEFIQNQRDGKLSVMLGYSDSTRDGSSLASDANLINATYNLKKIEEEVNQGSNSPISLCFYRGRGDTIPRGFGGSVSKSIISQGYNSLQEDHTEQNRFLRKYASVTSAMDHLNSVYSSHLTALLLKPVEGSWMYQRYFEFYGNLSFMKWNTLVREQNGGHGKIYFEILEKYSILPILSTCNFASRPVCRDGVQYNVENIRAIPFTMLLAQMREFTNGYYGTGTALKIGTRILEDLEGTIKDILYFMKKEKIESLPEVTKLIKEYGKIIDVEERNIQELEELFKIYGSKEVGVSSIALLLLDTHFESKRTPIDTLKKMYESYQPFKNSIDNKETSLLVRNYKIVQEYTKNATEQEKKVLEDPQIEAKLTKEWILKITNQDRLISKVIKKDFDSPELLILHKIQSRFLEKYHQLKKSGEKTKQIQIFLQMTILATSEALGFGG